MDELSSDVHVLKTLIAALPEFMRGFSDEMVRVENRAKALRMICDLLPLSGGMQNLLRMLLDRNRVVLLPEILNGLELKIFAHKKYLRVDVTVADGNSSEEIGRRIEGELSRRFGMKVECEMKTDESLLGGFVVGIGDERFDASVLNKLERMKEKLLRKV